MVWSLQFLGYLRTLSLFLLNSNRSSIVLNDRSDSTPRILTLPRILSTSVWNVWIIWSNLDYYCLFPNYKCNQSKKMKNFPTGKKAKEHFKAIHQRHLYLPLHMFQNGAKTFMELTISRDIFKFSWYFQIFHLRKYP